MAKLAAGGSIPVNSSLVGPVFLSEAAGGAAGAAANVVRVPLLLFLNAFEFQDMLKRNRVFDGPTSALFSIKSNTNVFRMFSACLHLQYISYMGQQFMKLEPTADPAILMKQTKDINDKLFHFTMIQLPNTETSAWVAITFKDALVLPVIEREYNGRLPDEFFEGRNMDGSRLMFNIWLSIKHEN